MTTALHTNLVAGALDAAAASGDTSLSSPAFADLPVVTLGTDHLFISLFRRNTTTGAFTQREIVKVTAHAASATTVTVVRGQEGTTAVAWVSGDFWTHAMVASEIGAGGGATILQQAAAPASPAAGDLWIDTDEVPPTGGGGTASIKTSKPAANITKSGTTLGSFSTPWTVTVTAAAGQVVVVEACVAGSNSTDSVTWLAIAKGGTVLTKAAKTYAGGEPRTSFTVIRWVDESPSVGTNTYEVYGASGGTLTVMGGNTLDTTTSLTTPGNSVLTAQAMNVAS